MQKVSGYCEMNIVHVVFSFHTGGIENLLVDVLNNWSNRDRLLLCIINDSIDEELLSAIRYRENVEVVCLRRPAGGAIFKNLLKMNHVFGEFQAEIVHFHSNSAFKFCMPLKLLHRRIQYFLTIHDTNIYPQISKKDCLLHRLFLNQIFAISRAVQEEVEKKGVYNTTLVYNGVDRKKFLNLPHGNNKRKTIICVARLQPEKKGQDILLHSIAILARRRSDFRCLIVGEAPVEAPGRLEELQKLAKKLGVESYVKFLGNRSDVPMLLAQSDIFVLPSRYEGFGISIIEAMLSKVLVIASDIDGIREILQNGRYGYLFEKENSRELAELLDYLLDDTRSDIVQSAYEYAVDHFSIETMMAGMRHCYLQADKRILKESITEKLEEEK